jgi:hypothetical protein
MMPRASSVVAPSPVLMQSRKPLSRLALWRSRPSNVDACPHTVFIHPSVLRHKSINLLPLWFEVQTKKPLWWFWDLNHQTIDFGFEAQIKKPVILVFFMCTTCIAQGITRTPDRPTIEYPTCARSSSILRIKSPTPALILDATHHVAFTAYISRDKQTYFSTPNNSIWVSSTEMRQIRIQIQTRTSQLLITQINQGTNHLVSHINWYILILW